jgi:hypothetical protein
MVEAIMVGITAAIMAVAITAVTIVITVAVITRIAVMDIITRMRAAFGMGIGTLTEWVRAGGGRTIMTNMFGSAPDQQEAIRS